MCSEVGISPKSLSYGFLNEIMDNLCSDGGPKNDRIGYTEFCEECTKGWKVRSEVGIDPQALSYGFQNEIMDYPYSNGGPRSDRIGCTKFNEGCTKFCE